MNLDSLNQSPHRRFNPLTNTWVLVSPHRTKRPWLGKQETKSEAGLPAHDPNCYLCPGNTRASGAHNPQYTGTHVFDNDFMALLPETSGGEVNDGLFIAKAERGLCRVICFSPAHNLTIAEMSADAVLRVVDCWTAQYRELMDKPFIHHVMIFENRGDIMGCSNPHPHCQIWCNESLPLEVERERDAQRDWQARHRHCLLCETTRREAADGTRVVYHNDHFLAVVPFWAVWPYEMLVIARRHVHNLTEFTDAERAALADMLRIGAIKFDNLFEISSPYSMGLHQITPRAAGDEAFHFHLHYYPPLLRSATVKKFMVGYEMLAEPQRDITPEAAAATLRSLPSVRFDTK